MNFTDWAGTIAAILTSISFLPQAIKTIRTRNTKAISLYSYILFVTGVGMWLFYGLLISDWPLIGANTLTFAFSSTILVYKVMDVVKGNQ
jgi:MtN3 and saliva related transmembrane protein